MVLETSKIVLEKEGKLDCVSDEEFKITMDHYVVQMNKDLVRKIKSPYGIDKYILEDFESQGFIFDRNRSQYIQYCFGNYDGTK